MGFPSSPANEAIYTNANGTRYQYDSTDNKWVVIGGAYSLDALTINKLNGADDSLEIESSIFYCSSAADIQAAIDDSTKTGKIIVISPGTHAITSQIDVDQGDGVIIMGHGNETILEPDVGVTVFDVNGSTNVVIKNLKIDMSNYTAATPAIIVDDTHVTIDSVKFDGTGDGDHGLAIDIGDFANCMVKNCEFMEIALVINCEGDEFRFTNNRIHDCDSTPITTVNTVDISGDNSVIIGNTIDTMVPPPFGVIMNIGGAYSIISNNIIRDISYSGMHNATLYVDGIHSVVSNNIITNITNGGAVLGPGGIYVEGGHSSISGNVIYNISHTSSGSLGQATGLVVSGDGNTIIGNTIHTISCGGTATSRKAYGIEILSSSNYNIIMGNHIYNIVGATEAYGIYTDYGTYTIIIGNQLRGETLTPDTGTDFYETATDGDTLNMA